MKENQKAEKKTYRAREARLTIDCTAEQKKKIKMLAAAKEMSITDFMLELVEEKYTWCPLGLSHIPNAETIASMEASEKGKGVKSFNSMDDLFKDLGI
jgi:antitoxin component of RelBE/YafQ-DinJ toxin-antitoxin module